jgi:hypothetical protein
MFNASLHSRSRPRSQPRPGAALDSSERSDVHLVRHRKRGDWGVAALLWERDGKRGYQFADGKLRVFKEGFYHLFESAPAPGDGSAKVVCRLARLARAEELTEATRLPTLRDQITMFHRWFPEGFGDAAWIRKHRGAGKRKRLKRHRDPAIEDARRLGAEQLERLIDARDWPAVSERLRAVVGCSNLVPSAHVERLGQLELGREHAQALRAWIVGHDDEAEVERRFNHLTRLLGPAGTWPVVTCIRGLLDPEHHTCVRPSAFAVQAKMLLPNFVFADRPRYGAYQRYLHVVESVRDELESADLQPRDLLDVHDFIWETLRPSVRAELLREYEVPPAEPLPTSQAA